jgi:wyosine [tRNA(Phe)-imidazoG37] synthetase (radical SAM superfamily)
MSILFEQSVFGPIKSRRFGFSLGINVLPTTGKICNFDCSYCECGSDPKYGERLVFPSKEEIITAFQEELMQKIDQIDRLDAITFAGNGEPTLHPDFEWIVREIKSLQQELVPWTKLILLSNGTTWDKENVANALKLFDVVQCKLDPFFEPVNRPKSSWNQQDLIATLQNCKVPFQLQCMLLKSTENPMIDGSKWDLLQDWFSIIQQVKPEEVILYTVERETPDSSIIALQFEELKTIQHKLQAHGIPCQLVY